MNRNKYLGPGGRVLITDGGEDGGDGDGGDGGDGEGGDEPTLGDIAQSIDKATDRMDDIHESVKSVEDTQEALQEKVNSNETAIEELQESIKNEEPEAGEGEGDALLPGRGPEGVTEEKVEQMVEEATSDLATAEDVEQASEKALLKFVGIEPDDLPEDEEEREEVIRKAVHETQSPGTEEGQPASEVAKRDGSSGEVVLDEDALPELGAD